MTRNTRSGSISAIPINVEVSPDQLLQAVAQMPSDELDAFVADVLTIRDARGLEFCEIIYCRPSSIAAMFSASRDSQLRRFSRKWT